MAFPKKVAIVGLGLIGGSLGQRILQKFPKCIVIGIPRRKVTLDLAKKKKAMSRGTLDIAAVAEADLVILATPIEKIIPTFQAMVPHLRPGTIVTDVASTKTMLVEEIEAMCPHGVYFVGGHPMAGTEHTGIEHAQASILAGATFVLTETKNTERKALRNLEVFIKKLGMKPLVLKPAIHDFVVAAVSHLPYIVAVTLAGTAKDVKSYQKLIDQVAATGFRDTTRVASSAPSWGKDIVSTNRDQLIETLDLFQNKLTELRTLIDNREFDKLEKVFSSVKKFRDELFSK